MKFLTTHGNRLAVYAAVIGCEQPAGPGKKARRTWASLTAGERFTMSGFCPIWWSETSTLPAIADAITVHSAEDWNGIPGRAREPGNYIANIPGNIEDAAPSTWARPAEWFITSPGRRFKHEYQY